MSREDLGFVIRRFTAVLVLLELLRMIEMLPGIYELAGMPGDNGGHRTLSLAIAIDLFVAGIAVLLWTRAEGFGRTLGGKSKGGLRLTTRGAQRVLFSGIGLYLLAIGLSGLGAAWGQYELSQIPRYYGWGSNVAPLWERGAQALIGIVILLLNNSTAVFRYLRRWPVDDALARD